MTGLVHDSEIGYWRAWVTRCEREAVRCEAEVVRWRGEKAEYARRRLAEVENADTLFDPMITAEVA